MENEKNNLNSNFSIVLSFFLPSLLRGSSDEDEDDDNGGMKNISFAVYLLEQLRFSIVIDHLIEICGGKEIFITNENF